MDDQIDPEEMLREHAIGEEIVGDEVDQ